MASFAAAISDWAKQTEGALEEVFHEAAQMVANEVRVTVNEGGRLPIDLGTLRRSLAASLAGMPQVSESEEGSGNNVELIIAGAELGSVVSLAFTVKYALRMEYGFVGTDSLGRLYNQAGFGFVAAVAQRWSTHVVPAAKAKVRGRFEAPQTGSATPSA